MEHDSYSHPGLIKLGLNRVQCRCGYFIQWHAPIDTYPLLQDLFKHLRGLHVLSQEDIKLIGHELDFTLKGSLESHWQAVAEKLGFQVSEVQAVYAWLVYKMNCGACI